MKSLKKIGLLAALSCWLACSLGSAVVQAQTPAPAAEATEENLSTRWAMAYGLTGLGVVLGLLNVCRPGKRKGDSPKPG